MSTYYAPRSTIQAQPLSTDDDELFLKFNMVIYKDKQIACITKHLCKVDMGDMIPSILLDV